MNIVAISQYRMASKGQNEILSEAEGFPFSE